jgi:putative transcriptional regulator
MGRTQNVLEHIRAQAKPTEAFRAFAGFAAWPPRQLESEMHLGAWGVLPPDSIGMFDKDPATLWQDCISRLQAPRVISN